MTTLRFVGDLPLWIGVSLSLIVAGLSWRYYSRESFQLPRRLKWILPLLRSLAFFLGVMMLTSPVLHHRQTIGELGKVKIYLDTSESMTLRDQQIPLSRKLKIVEQMGWIGSNANQSPDLILSERLQSLSEKVTRAIATFATDQDNTESTWKELSESLATELEQLERQLPPALKTEFSQKTLQRLTDQTAAAKNSEQLETLRHIGEACGALAETLQSQYLSALDIRNDAASQSIRSALQQFDQTSRWQRVEESLLAPTREILSRLKSEHTVQVIQLEGDQAQPLAYDDSPQMVQQISQPSSTVTDLSSGIISTQTESRSEQNRDDTPPAKSAVILITDGNHNSGPSPIQTARLLGAQETSFFPISFGAVSPAKHLSVQKIDYPDLVFAKDRVRGRITYHDSMPAGTPFVIQVHDGEQVLWQQPLVTQENGLNTVDFEFASESLKDLQETESDRGIEQHIIRQNLSVTIVPLSDEAEPDNNTAPMYLAVLNEQHRAMILDGRSRWETRYLRNAFERDERWELNTIIAGEGTANVSLPRGDKAGDFPDRRDELFLYDLIIIGEIAADLFQENELDWLREFVEIRGGGVIFVDGQRELLRSFTGTPVAPLLPVEWTASPASNTPPVHLELSEAGASVSSLQLAADKLQSAKLWKELPPPKTIIPVKAIPSAEVLVDVNLGSERLPAIITQRIGAGRVLFLAFDETWRWRYKVADLWHQRIWHQLAKFVMPRPFSVSDEYLSLDTGGVVYHQGDTVPVRVRLVDADGRPAEAVSAEAILWKDGQNSAVIPLEPDENIPGIFSGVTSRLLPGDYEVSIRASGYTDAALKARSEFTVVPVESAEFIETSANEELLTQMAEASGGAFLREEDLANVVELLKPFSQGRVVESETILWQSYWWFAMIIGLLTAEWILRKRAGLL